MYGQANIVSTASDLLQLDQALYTSRLLIPASLRRAFVPENLNSGAPDQGRWNDGTTVYDGLGWGVLCDTNMGQVVYHQGGMPGVSAIFIRNVTHGQTVILLDNVTRRNVRVAGMNIMRLLNNQPVHDCKLSLARIYTEDLIERGTDDALAHFNELKSETNRYYLDEGEMNGLAYGMVGDGHTPEALEAFRLNTLVFPSSWNAYDGYADILAKAGKKKAAILMYQKTVEMNPQDDTRSRYQRHDMSEQGHLLNQVAALVDAGRIRTTMQTNLGEINAATMKGAHKLVESGKTIGRIVLSGFGEKK
jgi:hypothetical protein